MAPEWMAGMGAKAALSHFAPCLDTGASQHPLRRKVSLEMEALDASAGGQIFFIDYKSEAKSVSTSFPSCLASSATALCAVRRGLKVG